LNGLFMQEHNGAPVIGIRNLYKDLGMFTLDAGDGLTGSRRSVVTYLPGEQGALGRLDLSVDGNDGRQGFSYRASVLTVRWSVATISR
jgi:hypothetical protein